jgi:hypothetical protein
MIAAVVNLHKETYDVYIGRGSIWGNPYEIGKDGSRKQVIAMYEERMNNLLLGDERRLWKRRILNLRGKRLGCYCKPDACHGDVLLKILNQYLKEESTR